MSTPAPFKGADAIKAIERTRAVLEKLGTVEDCSRSLVVRNGVAAASAAAVKQSGAATRAITDVMAKLRRRRMGRRGSATRALPIFKSMAAVDAAVAKKKAARRM